MSMYQPVNRAEFKNASVMMEGDTRNEIIVKLTDKNGAAVDLTGRTVTWTAANERGKLIENRPATIYAGGEVGIKFLATDSFGDGTVFLQFAVTWAAGQIERFPADGNLFMKVPRSHSNVQYTPVNYVTIQQIEAELKTKFDAYALEVQQGAKGDPGAGLVILGTLTSTAQLPTSGADGNAYLINGDLHVRANGQWTNAGRIQGPKGDTGNTGPAGSPGAAGSDGTDGRGLEFNWNGYTLGTRREGDTTFIYSQSLRGATGATGSQGIQGIQGIKGDTGNTGLTGAAGKNLEYSWNGYQLGVRQQGETTYTYSTSLRGATGATGSQGIQGIQGIPGPKGDTGNTGSQGIQGIPGIKGDKGDTGAGLNIKGSFTSTGQLPGSGTAGDAYLVNGALYVWNGTGWTNAGNIQGPAGEAGPIGETGPAGKNLEFLWNGYTLGVRQQGNATYTYSQSLRGAQGIQGIQGIQGVAGNVGQTGAAGKNLEFLWNGTQLGVRQEGAASYTYVDLKGAKGDTGNTGLTGNTGAAGKDLEFLWTGTSLGVRQQGQSTYTSVNLQGPQGIQGIKGDTGNTGLKGDTGSPGIQGIQGIQGVAGKNLEFVWSGMTLGVRQQGAATYTYSASLQGPQGIQGIQGIQGNKGDKGDTGSPGTNATLNIELRTSDPASPAAGQVWLRTDLTT